MEKRRSLAPAVGCGLALLAGAGLSAADSMRFGEMGLQMAERISTPPVPLEPQADIELLRDGARVAVTFPLESQEPAAQAKARTVSAQDGAKEEQEGQRREHWRGNVSQSSFVLRAPAPEAGALRPWAEPSAVAARPHSPEADAFAEGDGAASVSASDTAHEAMGGPHDRIEPDPVIQGQIAMARAIAYRLIRPEEVRASGVLTAEGR